MSFAADILKAAVERQQKLNAEHAAALNARAETLSEVIRRPWKDRVEAIGEAVNVVREILKPTEGSDEQ